MNWSEGLRRVSVVLWAAVGLVGVGYCVFAFIFEPSSRHLSVPFAFAAVLLPIVLHTLSCRLVAWVIGGFKLGISSQT